MSHGGRIEGAGALRQREKTSGEERTMRRDDIDLRRCAEGKRDWQEAGLPIVSAALDSDGCENLDRNLNIEGETP